MQSDPVDWIDQRVAIGDSSDPSRAGSSSDLTRARRRVASGLATPNDLALLAGLCLSQGQYREAAEHLGAALLEEPGRADLLGLTERIYQAVGPDPESILPMSEDSTDPGLVLLRAWWLMRRGDELAALGVLADLNQQYLRSEALLHWGLPWIEQGAAHGRLEPKVQVLTLLMMSGIVPEMYEDTVADRALMVCCLEQVERLAQAHPNLEMMDLARATLLRKAGRLDKAEALARAVLERDSTTPPARAQIALAAILREGGRVDEALEIYRRLERADPDRADPIRLGAGDMLVEARRFYEALDWYHQVLKHDEENSWAIASALVCHYELDDPPGQRDALRRQLFALAEGETPNRRAGELVRRWIAFDGFLPTPGDDTVKLLQRLLVDPQFAHQFGRPAAHQAMILSQADSPSSDKPEPFPIPMAVWEAPSNRLVWQFEQRRRPGMPDYAPSLETIPEPDPRQALGTLHHPLWKIEGTKVRPALDPPRPEVARAIASLASADPQIPQWWQRARHLALYLGVERIPDILAVMVHPPEIPEGRPQIPAWAWIPRLQVAAALTIARMDANWDDRSPRRTALGELIRGPLDWTITAAILALDGIAHTTPAAAPDVAVWFEELYRRTPRVGHWDHLNALFWHWPGLPGLDPIERAEIERLRDAFFESDGPDEIP